MALVVKDRVRETSTTAGTGSFTLAGAVAGFQSFQVIGSGNTTYYTIVDAATGDWEVGIGTYTLTGTSLSRDTVLESSNAGNKVDFAVGTKDVFVTYPAERSIYVDNGVITPAVSATLPNTSVTGLGTMSTQDATNVNIDGGAIDGVTLGTNSPVTNAQIDNININGNTVSSTNTNGNIIFDPNGTGFVQEDVGGTDYNLVSQYDIGTAPNEIPLNQYLGNLAYQDAGSIAGNVVVGGGVTANDASVISVNSSSAALRVTQTGSGNALVVEDSTNPDSTPTVIDANGNLVVGLATASFPLHVVGQNSGTPNLLGVELNAAATPGILIRRSNGTNASKTAVADGSGLLNFFAQGYDGTNYITGASISAAVDGTPGTNDMPGRLVFSTTPDGGSSPVERMRIDSAGRVGIGGTASTFVKFNIRGTLPSASTASRAVEVAATIPSASTAQGFGFYTTLSTQADTFTLPTLDHFRAGQGSIGFGSTVTNQSGFSAENTLTGATNNYGFYSNIASGTGRWNFYAAGSAANYFAGQTIVGTTVFPTGTTSLLTVKDRFDVSYSANNQDVITLDWSSDVARIRSTTWGGTFRDLELHTGGGVRLRLKTTGQTRFVPLASDPSGAEAGDVYYNSSSNKLKVYNGTSWVDLH